MTTLQDYDSDSDLERQKQAAKKVEEVVLPVKEVVLPVKEVKMSGRDREAEARKNISSDMRARANRRASAGGDVLAAQLQSETIRNLQTCLIKR